MLLDELLKQLPSLGVGGLLALFIYVSSKRREDMFIELWQKNSDILLKVVADNTDSNKKLISLIETAERNSIRKSDLFILLDEVRARDLERASGKLMSNK